MPLAGHRGGVFYLRDFNDTQAIRARLAVNTAEAAIDAALGGLGVTRVLSYQAVEHVRPCRTGSEGR